MRYPDSKTGRNSRNWRVATLALLLAITMAAAALTGCARYRYFRPGVQLYLAHNLWTAGEPKQIRSINFKVGDMIPAGTPVSRAAVRGDWLRFTANGRWHQVYIVRKYRPNVNIHTVASRMFTDKTFDQLTADFTKDEVQYIQNGEIGPDMSKEAVLASWGYPPEHKTGSIAADMWVYYRTRFNAVKVWFGADDRVTRIKD